MKPNTRQAILDSFRRLLLAKSLDKMTVRDIVEDCNLTRNTFYYYYEDIYDLFDDYLDKQLQAAWQSLPPGSSWDTMLCTLIGSVFDQPQTGRHIFHSHKRDSMRLYLNKLISSLLERYISENAACGSVSADDRRLICDTCCCALYGLLEQWLSGPEAPLMQQNLRRVTQCFAPTIQQALAHCAAHPERREILP